MKQDKTLDNANALFAAGKLREAANVLAARIRRGNGCAQTLHLCGVIMLKIDNIVDAERYFRAALALAPSHPAPLSNLGVALRRANRNHEAIDVLEQALLADPSIPAVRHNLASAYYAVSDFEHALKHIEIAVKMDPGNIKMRLQYAEILREVGRFSASLFEVAEAYKNSPRFRGLAGDHYLATRLLADWKDWVVHEAVLDQLISESVPACTPFTFLSVKDDLQMQANCVAAWNAKLTYSTVKKAISAKPRERLRIGYFSADYRNHPAMHLMIEMFEKHDRVCFETFAYAFGPESDDPWATRARRAFDHFVDVRSMSQEDIIDNVRVTGIDIAVDLMGHTKHNRISLFARGLAPIQLNYMGFPGTLGTDFHDYIIADPVLIPEQSRSYYTEKVAYLPDCYMANCRDRDIAALPSKAELKLPEDCTIFCCFNQTYKITPEVFDGWMQILSRVPNSVLWLWISNQVARENLRNEASIRGVDPERLIFADTLPVDQHLARLPHADLFLDTRPYNAHTTASDALRMGVPILTCIGEAFASRVAASLLSAVGLTELITQSEEEYVEKAIELGRRPELLRSLKDKLRANLKKSSLFDSERFTRNMERLYLEMHRRAVAGEPPREIVLGKS